jgi:hypothetical protein
MKKLQKFAVQPTLTAPATYAGEAASGFIAAALLSAKTLDNEYVTIHPNVKYKEVVQKIDVSSIINDASCDFETTGSVAISERVLTPKELQVNLQLCKSQFIASWEALSLGFSAFNEIPQSFTDYLVSYVGGLVAEATETSIWQGSESTNGQFRGLEGQLSASIAAGGAGAVLAAKSGSVIISGSVTSGNVISVLGSVYDTIPSTVYGKQDVLIYVGTKVGKAYQTALGGNANQSGFQTQMNVGEKPFNFQGIEIVLCPGMSDNKIIAAQKSNLHFATGLMSDYNQVKVLDMSNLDGSDNFRIIMRYTADTTFGVGQDIVYFGAY